MTDVRNAQSSPPPRAAAAGFTLIELIVVMVVVGVLAGIVAVFIRTPILGYLDSARRAELADAADSALLRMAREVRAALPNSVRVREHPAGSGIYYLEFLPVRDGGRYRAEPTGAGGGDILDFASGTDASFDVLGPAVQAAAGDFVVVYNLGVGAETDAWQGGNRRDYSGATGTVSGIAFTATGTPLPFESPGRRFYLTAAPVTYVCDPTAGTLRRYGGYAVQAVQPVDAAAPPLSGVTGHLLAGRVSGCRFAYDPGASERLGQLTLWLRLTAEGESVSLYREVLVNNEA